jgi:hypothetical protein
MATLECKYHERGKALENLKILSVKGEEASDIIDEALKEV